MVEKNRISDETMIRLNLIPITYETEYPKCTSPEDTAVIKKLLAMFGELDPDNKIKSFVVSGMSAQLLSYIHENKCKCGSRSVETVTTVETANDDDYVDVCTECYVKMDKNGELKW